MKSDVCERKMNEFLVLDKHQIVPFSVCVHLLLCKKCRTQVRLMTLAEKKLARDLSAEVPLSDEKFASLMQQVDPNFSVSDMSPVSFAKWVGAGVSMIGAMLIFVVWDYVVGATGMLAPAIYSVFGVCIASYCTVFVGSNMDFFVKKINASRSV